MIAPTGFVPADAAERERIRTALDENMLVEASAGTGKTTVLVGRIVHMLTSGIDVTEIAALTFNEKAASELSARVRVGIEEALTEATDDATTQRLVAALRGLNRAHIETYHAFASGLLRERPVEADLDPGFEVLDELPAQLDFENAFNEWLNAAMANEPPPQPLVNALNLGLRFPLVREAAERLQRHRDLLPLPVEHLLRRTPSELLADLQEPVDALREMLHECRDPADRGLVQALAQIEQYERFVALNDEASLARALAHAETPDPRLGQAGSWRTGRKAVLQQLMQEIREALDAAKACLREAAVSDLLRWLQGFVGVYEQQRRAAGKADFDDLLIWARRLIRDDQGVRRYFQEKFRYILVDEFQDTDPLQAEIIVRLCAQDDVDDWRRATLRPGALFAVGDPKQSIYRFRRADIAMYDDVKRDVFGGEPVRVRQNFRSVCGIIDWVNRVFEPLFPEAPRVQPPYALLDAHPDYATVDAVTLLKDLAVATRPDDIRKLEAARVAALIRRSVDDGAWTVRDGATARPARFGDVVIIVPARTGLEFYEEALARAGVPHRHEGRTFFGRQEVRDLAAVLRAVDDPGDGVAAIAALRSPAFGCSDEELLLHRAAGWRFDSVSLHPDATGTVADALRRLHELAKKRHDLPLPELVRHILDQTQLVEFAMTQHQGDQVAANLLKVIDQARTFAEASGAGLRGFVRWLRENILRDADESDASISEETDDVVRIMTVHASKGLEFPVVVFANMNGARVDRTVVIADRATGELHMKLGAEKEGFWSPGFKAAADAELNHEKAEERRKLYVAATRAKDHLVVPLVSGRETPDDPNCLNDWLRAGGADEGDSFDLRRLPEFADEPPWWRAPYDAAVSASEVQRVVHERAEWASEHTALVARGAEPLLVRTATALKPEWQRASGAQNDGVVRGRAADFGSAVHALLERSALRDDADIDALAAAVAAEFGQAERAGEMADVARLALASDVVARAHASPRVLLEAPFTVALPSDDTDGAEAAGGLAEGRIDLMFEEDGALVIVDFKTDGVRAADVAAYAEARYRTQALVYAWAAQSAARMPVREVVMLFARPGVEHAFAVDDAFIAEAESLLRAPAADTDDVTLAAVEL